MIAIFQLFLFSRESSDGRLLEVAVYDLQKRYSPERHYMFILRVRRAGVTDPIFLFRTYKEFCELESKLSTEFPHSQIHR